MSNVQHMTADVIALELVKIEKQNPTSLTGGKDAATLYVEYYKKVSEVVNPS